MIIRQANTADTGAICAIWNGIVRDTDITFTTVEKSDAEIAADIAARGTAWLVAEEGDQVIGFATYGPFRGGPGYAHTMEHSIHLAPAARGLGAGRALMERLEQVARAEGVHVLVAGISGTNPGAVAFHARLGFEEVGRMPQVGRKGGEWLDLLLMQKILGHEGDTGPDSATASG